MCLTFPQIFRNAYEKELGVQSRYIEKYSLRRLTVWEVNNSHQEGRRECKACTRYHIRMMSAMKDEMVNEDDIRSCVTLCALESRLEPKKIKPVL